MEKLLRGAPRYTDFHPTCFDPVGSVQSTDCLFCSKTNSSENLAVTVVKFCRHTD